MHVGMQFTADLCHEMLATPPAELLTYQAAFEKYVGIDPHAATADELHAAVKQRGISAPESLTAIDRDAWLDLLLVSLVNHN